MAVDGDEPEQDEEEEDPSLRPEALLAAILAAGPGWKGSAKDDGDDRVVYLASGPGCMQFVAGSSTGFLGVVAAVAGPLWSIRLMGLALCAIALWHIYRTRDRPAYALWILPTGIRVQYSNRRVWAAEEIARVRVRRHTLSHGTPSQFWDLEILRAGDVLWRPVMAPLARERAEAVARAISALTGAERIVEGGEPGT